VTGRDLHLRQESFEIIGVHWSPTGLDITRDLTYNEVESVAFVLSKTTDASRWGLCDALAHAERRWGEDRYSQLSALTGRSVGGLMNLARLARRVPPDVRRPELTLGHHEEVAGLKIAETDEPDHDAQRRWLAHAVELRLTRDELRAQVQAAQPRADLTRRVRSDDQPSPVIESTPAMDPLEAVAREILAAPVELDGRTCVSADVRERLRQAVEAS
jgi:hypothetical protein